MVRFSNVAAPAGGPASCSQAAKILSHRRTKRSGVTQENLNYCNASIAFKLLIWWKKALPDEWTNGAIVDRRHCGCQMRNPNIIVFVAQSLCGRALSAKSWPCGEKRSNSGEWGAGRHRRRERQHAGQGVCSSLLNSAPACSRVNSGRGAGAWS